MDDNLCIIAAMTLSPGMQRVLRSIERAKRRRARALALRESGLTVAKVGRALGVNKQRASQLILEARRDRRRQAAVPRETEEAA